MKRRIVMTGAVLITVGILGGAGFWSAAALVGYPTEVFSQYSASQRIEDRNGRLLRSVPFNRRGERARYVPIENMGKWVPAAIVAVEDQRYFSHVGIDPVGIVRAGWTNITAGEVVSGGSTITQQLARTVDPALRQRNRWERKAIEVWDAVRIERTIDKKRILEIYLNNISFGNRAIGIGEASERYFGKTPDRLTVAEAAFLAGLPQAPTAYSPYTAFDKALNRQKTVLRRMYEEGYLSTDQYEQAREEEVVVLRPDEPFEAAHFLRAAGVVYQAETDTESKAAVDAATDAVWTSLDLGLQKRVVGLVNSHLQSLRSHAAAQASVVVLDVATGEVLAWVGSPDFFDGSRGGEVDGVTALRQPGSTLKPFLYALALENGMTPATLLDDSPPDDLPDDFRPRNYDRQYHGKIRLRTALACSYNIPAVRVLHEDVGVARFLAFLRQAGMPLDKSEEHYGLALALGSGEVRLIDLARAYAMLARGGVDIPVRFTHTHSASAGQNEMRRLLDEQVAAQITSILSDCDARRPAFGRSPLDLPFTVAAKTGTSKDYRDNWTIGYTPRHVVAVWVGNFDGSSLRNSSGVTGAAPLFRDVMLALGDGGEFESPGPWITQRICAESGALADAECTSSIEERFRAEL